ncbi:MAG: hypothetical protein R6U50_00795 [Desulfobacterales bacterium]
MNTVGVVVLASHTLEKTGAANAVFSDTKLAKINICIDNILHSGINDIAVVVNQEQWEIGAALSGYPVCIAVYNGLHDALDMVDTGIQALPGYITGVIIIKHDNQPVLSEKFALLEKFHHHAPQCAVLPGDQRQNGYAALFPIESYHALSKGLMVDNLITRECGQLHAVQ